MGVYHACPSCGFGTARDNGGECEVCSPACDCSEEYGPCEDHSELLVSREGASLRTADDLTMVRIDDLIACGAMPSDENRTEITRLETALEAERDSSSGCTWFDDPDDRDAAIMLADDLEGNLPDGVRLYSDDGYRIVRIVGGPLFDGEVS